jgi:chromosome segregation ATPase
MTNDQLYLLTEAAELTGVTVDTIRQRIKRRKLYAVKGNDGRVRVKLSEADIAALKASQPTSQLVNLPTSRLAEDSSTIKAFEAQVQRLLEDLNRERAERAEERKSLRDEITVARADTDRERRRATETDMHARDLADRIDKAHREHAAERAQLRQELNGLKAEMVTERHHGRELADRLDQAHRDRATDVDRLQTELETARRPWWRRMFQRQ